MANVLLGKLKTRFDCRTNIEEETGTFFINFNSPYRMERYSDSFSRLDEKLKIGNLTICYRIVRGETAGKIFRYKEKFDVTKLNLKGLSKVCTTIFFCDPPQDDSEDYGVEIETDGEEVPGSGGDRG